MNSCNCCINGLTATPDVSDVCVCNASEGAVFVGTGGRIFVRTSTSNPCAASDWTEITPGFTITTTCDGGSFEVESNDLVTVDGQNGICVNSGPGDLIEILGPMYTGNGAPAIIPADPDSPALYTDCLTEELYYWDNCTDTWVLLNCTNINFVKQAFCGGVLQGVEQNATLPTCDGNFVFQVNAPLTLDLDQVGNDITANFSLDICPGNNMIFQILNDDECCLRAPLDLTTGGGNNALVINPGLGLYLPPVSDCATERPWGIGDGAGVQPTNCDPVTVDDPIFHNGTMVRGATSIQSISAQMENINNFATGNGGHDLGASTNSSVLSGLNNTIASSQNSAISGNDNTIQVSFDSSLMGGQGNLVNQSDTSGMVGGTNNIIFESVSAFVGAGDTNIVSSADNASIISGATNTIIGDMNSNITAGTGNTILTTQFGGNAILASNTSSINPGPLGGGSNAIVAGGANIMTGGVGNLVSGIQNSITGGGSTFVSGTRNDVTGSSQSFITGADNFVNLIDTSNVSGRNNTIANVDSMIIGGQNNNVSGLAPGDPTNTGLVVGGNIVIQNSVGSWAGGTDVTITHERNFIWNCCNNNLASNADCSIQFSASGGITFYSDCAFTTGVTLAPGSSAFVAVSSEEFKVRHGEISNVLGILEQLDLFVGATTANPDERHFMLTAENWNEAIGGQVSSQSISQRFAEPIYEEVLDKLSDRDSLLGIELPGERIVKELIGFQETTRDIPAIHTGDIAYFTLAAVQELLAELNLLKERVLELENA